IFSQNSSVSHLDREYLFQVGSSSVTPLRYSITSRGRLMSEQEDRLIRCFASVFPMSTPQEIQTAGPEWFAASESLAVVTLAAVIQEEFGIEMNTSDLAELNSFGAILDCLRQRSSTAK